MMIYIGITIFLGIVGVISVIGYKLKRAADEIEQLVKTNQQLEIEKKAAQIQVKNHQTRQNNEKTHRTSDRDQLIDRLQQSNDLRD